MDGISGAAAVVGLGHAATQVTAALVRYVSRVREAESSCAKLLDQIRFIATVQTTISRIMQNSPRSTHAQELQVLVDDWLKDDGPPTKCKQELDELASWLEMKEVEPKTHKKWARKLAWPVKEDKIRKAMRVFEGHMPYFRDIVMSKMLDLAGDMATRIKKSELVTKKSELLSWLDGFDCTNKHESTLRQRQKTTGNWLFKEELYIDWRNGSTKFIWLRGKPGAGKSVLASAVIDDISNGLAENETLAYFYCDFRNSRCTSAMEIARSITKQLLWSSKADWLASFSDLTSRKERGVGPPTDLGTLMDLLKRAIKLHERPMIVVDALDECEDLQNLLDGLMKLGQGQCRLFVTSRTLRVIEEAFWDVSRIVLDDRAAEVWDDIHSHVGKQLESRSRLKILGKDLKDEIEGVLMKKADGMFRWVQCQLDRLNDCYSIGDIREVLDTLPATLYETYEQMLRAIDKKPFGPRIASRALKWLVLALRPLKLSELATALEISCDKPAWDSSRAVIHESVILEILGSLVSIDQDQTITLSHYSVKEFLTSAHLAHSIYFVSRPSASLELATVSIFSLILLAGDSKTTITAGFEGHALSRYASHCGLQHLADCHPDHNELLVRHLLALQSHIFTHRLVYERVFQLPRPWLSGTLQVALYMIIRFGHPDLLRYYVEHSPILVTEENPLVYAALYGDVTRVEILLGKNLDINLESAVFIHFRIKKMTPLMAAAQNEREEHQVELVKLLIESGCTVPVDVIHRILGCRLTPCKLAVFRILLDRGADPRLLYAGKRSCLHLFLAHPRKLDPEDGFEVARMLVTAGCDPMVQDIRDTSCLCLAIMYHFPEFVEWLIQRDPHLQLPSNSILLVFSADSTLSLHRLLPMLQLLDRHGADARTRDAHGSNALHLLESRIFPHDCGIRTSIVRWLVKHGCDINCKNDAGETPLQLAAAYYSFTPVDLNLYVDQGAEVPTDIVNYVAMRWSFQENEGKIAALRLLVVKFGASCRSWTIDGDNALHCLLKDSHAVSTETIWEVASLLVKNGCDVYALNSSGETPLQLAIENGHFSIAQSISEWMTKPHPVGSHTTSYHGDSEGNGILHRLCLRNDKQFKVKIELLRDAGYDFSRDINRPNKSRLIPLCIAFAHCGIADDLAIIAPCLLHLGASFYHVDYISTEGLEWASDLPWYPDVTAAHIRCLNRSKTTPEDVVLVDRLLQVALQGRVSCSVTRSILDMAEYWACVKVTRQNVQYTTAYDYDPITLPTVPGNGQRWVPRRLVFTCKANSFVPYIRDHCVLIWVRVSRANSIFTVPINLGVYCNADDPPRVMFAVWDEFTAAEELDGRRRLMVEELTTEDVLSMGFDYTNNEHFTLEFFRVKVYFALRPVVRKASGDT